MRNEDYKCAPDEAEGVDRGQLVGRHPDHDGRGWGVGVSSSLQRRQETGGHTQSEPLAFNQRAAGSPSRSLHSGEYHNQPPLGKRWHLLGASVSSLGWDGNTSELRDCYPGRTGWEMRLGVPGDWRHWGQ